MKNIFCIFVLSLSFFGCSNFNPRNNPKIENQDGQIEDIKTNQNGVMLELAKVRQQGEITNSTLKDIQQGLLNINAAVSKNENSGIQILQGDGALILVFSVSVVGMILWHYRSSAKNAQKALDLVVKEVVRLNDESLNDNIIFSAKKYNLEKIVLQTMKKEL